MNASRASFVVACTLVLAAVGCSDGAGEARGSGEAAIVANGSSDVPLYGVSVPSVAQSLVFVVDVSGSMNADAHGYTGLDGNPTSGSRLDRAKVELARAIQSLHEDFAFNVVAYDCGVRAWSATRQKATPATKASAIAWVSALRASGGSDVGSALGTALQDRDNFTVVVLSDGAPNCIGDGDGTSEDHRASIQSSNTQGAVIHVFGLHVDGTFAAFLRDVAATSGGRYYSVP